MKTLVFASFALLAAPPQRTGEWVLHMDGLAAALTSLLTNANAESLDENKRTQLRNDVKALRSMTHRLSSMRAPDADPTISFLLRELDDAIDDTSRADDGALSDAALSVAWTCMACHARASHGTARPIASLAPIDPSLPADVRGVALAATRRLHDALSTFREAAFDEAFARNEPYRWERSVRGALLLEMRLQHDAHGALEIVDQVINTPDAQHLWEDASAWRAVLVPMVKSGRPWPRTPQALDAEADRLMSEAGARGTADPAREILYLRATSIVHELLMRDPPTQMRAQALAWLGEGYAGLRDLDIWRLHLVYDAACVEAAPQSILARECYDRWLDGARAAFTGNGGGTLPPAIAEQRRRLRSLVGGR